jgi:hypothetical protein
MSHVVYPEGEGFVVAGVWCSETEGRDYIGGRLRGLIADVDLTPGRPTRCPRGLLPGRNSIRLARRTPVSLIGRCKPFTICGMCG